MKKIIVGVLIIVIFVLYVLLNRYTFIHLNGSLVIRCNNLTGACILQNAEQK